jgi:hypothetical protein
MGRAWSFKSTYDEAARDEKVSRSVPKALFEAENI